MARHRPRRMEARWAGDPDTLNVTKAVMGFIRVPLASERAREVLVLHDAVIGDSNGTHK
jgi:hypothetical protein